MGGGSLFGLIMLVGSIVLYALGRIKPEIRRDSDIIYVCVGIVYAITTIVSVSMAVIPPGIVEFQNLLAVGCIISLMWQNIRDRQSKPQIPGRDGGFGREGTFDSLRQRFSSNARRRPGEDNRPANSVYRYEAEFDDYSRFNGPPPREQRRIVGSEPPRGGYDDGYGGRGDRYDERSRGPRPALNDADRPRDRSGRDDLGRNDLGDRPVRRPGPERGPRQDDWNDDFGAPSRGPERPPSDSFGPDRGRDRSRPPRPRDDRSMEGRPISGPILEEDDFPEAPADNLSSNPPNRNRPPQNAGPLELERSPMDMPPRRRPRSEGPLSEAPRSDAPQGRPPLGRPLEGPLAGSRGPGPRPAPRDGGDRPGRELPNRRPPAAERPVIDAAPVRARPQSPPAGPGPARPLDSSRDAYVDFKPVEPPPADEFDNSNQFDD